MSKKQYNLKTILTDSTYKDMSFFLAKTLNGEENKLFGVDALAMVGCDGVDAVSLTKVVQMFQTLADPKFINLRKDWGSNFYGANEVEESIRAYAGEKFNSFALKNTGVNLSYVQFPVFQNHMGANNAFKASSLSDSWENIKQNFEKAIGIQIVEVENLEEALNGKLQSSTSQVAFDGKLKKDGIATRAVRKLLSPVVFVKNKITGHEKNCLDQKSLRLDKAFSKCIISSVFNGHKLSETEKVLALTDALSHESMKRFALNDKTTKSILSSFEEADKRKILYASQLTADLFATFAQDLGAENHRQIENALKLQISNVLASMQDKSYRATKAYGAISQRLTGVLLSQLNLSRENIVVARHNMGVDYVDAFAVLENGNKIYNLNHVMFGRIQTNAFNVKNGEIVYQGESSAFENLQPFASEYVEKTITPYDKNPEVAENLAPLGVADSKAQPIQKQTKLPRTISIDDVFGAFDEKQPEIVFEPDWIGANLDQEMYNAVTPMEKTEPTNKITIQELVDIQRARHNETLHAQGNDEEAVVEKQLGSQTIAEKSRQTLWAVHLPKAFRQAINQQNFQNPQAQEFLACMDSAVKQGKVKLEERKYAQQALEAGIKVQPEDMFVYVATSETALHEVRKKLEAISQKYGRIEQKLQAEKDAETAKIEEPAKENTAPKSQKKKEVLVVKLPKALKHAIKSQNFQTKEVQEYLKYLYQAVESGEIKVEYRQDLNYFANEGVKSDKNGTYFYVAKDGKTLFKIQSDLGKIKEENSKGTKKQQKIFAKKNVAVSAVSAQGVPNMPTEKPQAEKKAETAEIAKEPQQVATPKKQSIVLFDETHAESRFPREEYLENTEYINKILEGTQKYLAYKKAQYAEKGQGQDYVEKFLRGLDTEFEAEHYAKEFAEFLGIEQKEIVLEKMYRKKFESQCRIYGVTPQNYVKNSYCVEDDKNIYYKLVLDMPKQILQDVAKAEYGIEKLSINAKPVPRTGYRDEFYPYIKYVRDSRSYEETEEKVEASDLEPAQLNSQLQEDKKQLEEKVEAEKPKTETKKVASVKPKRSKKISDCKCRKCQKKQDKTVCVGKDGTIYYPFH